MNFFGKVCRLSGSQSLGKNGLRLQALVLRDFKTSGASLRASMRSRMERIRSQTNRQMPFSQNQAVSKFFLDIRFDLTKTWVFFKLHYDIYHLRYCVYNPWYACVLKWGDQSVIRRPLKLCLFNPGLIDSASSLQLGRGDTPAKAYSQLFLTVYSRTNDPNHVLISRS